MSEEIISMGTTIATYETPTMKLRWIFKEIAHGDDTAHYEKVLQQKWQITNGVKMREEWRDIEIENNP